MPEYDVWRCFTKGRTTYKCVEVKGNGIDNIKVPANAVSHLNRLHASNTKQAVNETLRMIGKGKQ